MKKNLNKLVKAILRVVAYVVGDCCVVVEIVAWLLETEPVAWLLEPVASVKAEIAKWWNGCNAEITVA